MSQKAWKKANVDESAYWEIFTCEVETLKHQDIYMQALGITQDYY